MRRLPNIPTERVFPLTRSVIVFPVDETYPSILMPGNSKRLLLGQLGYPFGDAHFSGKVSSIGWKKEGDAGFTAVALGNYPDLLTAARFVSFTPSIFDKDLVFTIKITDTDNKVQERDISIISDVQIGTHKIAKKSQLIKLFTDSTFATDATKVAAIKYEVSGATTVAKTAITRKVLISGTHNGASNLVKLVDTTKNFLTLGIRKDDVVKNTTDGGSAKVTTIATTTNSNDTLNLGAITGGVENDFDATDAYTVSDGDSLILIVQKFEKSFTAVGNHLVTLYITDTKTPAAQEFSAGFTLEVG